MKAGEMDGQGVWDEKAEGARASGLSTNEDVGRR
jgi:hypothetical protein